jgi:hypothetical protein
VHVDRARAEEELRRDLAVRHSLGDESHHFGLAASERGDIPITGRAAKPLLDRFAELLGCARGTTRERACAELSREPVRLGLALDRELALSGGREGDSGSVQDLGALGGDPQRAVQLGGASELLGGELRLPVSERDLAKRVGQRRQRIAVAGARGDPGERARSCVRFLGVPRAGK